MNKNIKIIIATHKKYKMPEQDIYYPLHVGAKGKADLGYMKDSTGDNISEKNPYFCELTGLYWAWKNLNADFIGLVHYRRYFYLKKKRSANLYDSILTSKEAQDLCQLYDVILPQKRHYYIETIYSHYQHTHYSEQLDLTRTIIAEKYSSYLKSFDEIVHQTSGYMFNMFILNKNLLDAYCIWLFDILFELEKRITLENKYINNISSYQARFYGRISEIIFNVWLKYQFDTGIIDKKQIIEIGCMHMEKINWRKKGVAFLKAKFMGKKYENSF